MEISLAIHHGDCPKIAKTCSIRSIFPLTKPTDSSKHNFHTSIDISTTLANSRRRLAYQLAEVKPKIALSSGVLGDDTDPSRDL